jgi:phosphate transport system substrate-binding protein
LKKIFLTATTLFLVSSLLFTGCAKKANNGGNKQNTGANNKIVSVGSTAILPLTKQAADEFKKNNPNVQITASGGGSVEGAQGVIKGSAQIGACDWDASKDVPGFKAFDGVIAHKVAVIPFATIVNKANEVQDLSTEQLQGIFTGKLTNWKEVGGKDAPIVVVNRAFGSGTRVNYQLSALKGMNTDKGQNQNYKEVKSSGEMVTSIASTPNAIGYVDLVYVKKNPDVKALKYNKVEANNDNVINGSYPVFAYGYYLTKGQPTGKVKEFIDYVQSNNFQEKNLKAMDFIPITAIK